MHQEDTLYKIQIGNLSSRENVSMLKAEKIKERCSTCCHSPTGYIKNDSSTFSAFCCSKCKKPQKPEKKSSSRSVEEAEKAWHCSGNWYFVSEMEDDAALQHFVVVALASSGNFICPLCATCFAYIVLATHTHKHTETHTSAVMFNMRHSHGIQMTKTCDQSCYRAIEQFVQIC